MPAEVGVKERFYGIVVRAADRVFDRIPVDLAELCFQFDHRVGYIGISGKRPAEEIDRVGDLQHFVDLRFLMQVDGLDRDPPSEASATPISAPNIVSSMFDIPLYHNSSFSAAPCTFCNVGAIMAFFKYKSLISERKIRFLDCGHSKSVLAVFPKGWLS